MVTVRIQLDLVAVIVSKPYTANFMDSGLTNLLVFEILCIHILMMQKESQFRFKIL